MEHIKLFETQEEYLVERDNLPYPCVSYIEETKTVEYKELFKSIIKARYKITQEVIDECEEYGLDEIILYKNNIDSVSSYSLNGETYNFEEPIYESGELKVIEFEPLSYDVSEDFGFVLHQELVTTATTFSTNHEITENDYIVQHYLSRKSKYFLRISGLTSSNQFIFSEDLKSFSFTQEGCDFVNNNVTDNIESVAFYYLNAEALYDDETTIDYNLICDTVITNGDETKNLKSYLVESEFHVAEESLLPMGEVNLTQCIFSTDKEIDLENDLLCFSYFMDGFKNTIGLAPFEILVEEHIIVLNDNNTFVLTQEFIDNFFYDVPLDMVLGNFFVFNINEMDESGGLTQKPSIKTTIEIRGISNYDKIFNGTISIPFSQDELDKEYSLEISLTEDTSSVGIFSGIFSEFSYSALEEVDFNGLSTNIGYGIPSNSIVYSNIETLVVPKSITNISPSSAIEYCYNLKNVYLHEGIILDSYEFQFCPNIENLYLETLDTILHRSSYDAWYNNSLHHEYLTFNGTNIYINNELLTDLVIPEGETNVQDFCFYGNKTITSVTLPESMISVGKSSFEGCESLCEITFKSEIMPSIQYNYRATNGQPLINYSFDYISDNGVVYYPSNSKGYDALKVTPSLKNWEINAIGDTNTYAKYDLLNSGAYFSYQQNVVPSYSSLNSIINLKINGNNSLVKEYLATSGINDIEYTFGGHKIPNNLFKNFSQVGHVYISKNIDEIGENAFNGSSLKTLTCYNPIAPKIYENSLPQATMYNLIYYPKGADYSSWKEMYPNYTYQEIDIPEDQL